MIQFIVKRVIQTIPVLFLGSLGVFMLLRLIPGDPADALLSDDATQEDYDRIHEQLGLTKSYPEQYMTWIGGIIRGDFGVSVRTGLPVSEILSASLPASLELAVAAYIIALLVGLPFGVIAGIFPRSIWDWLLSFYTVGTFGIPNFVLGILLLWVFSVNLGWFPVAGRVSILDDPQKSLELLALPAITLGSGIAAVLARYARSSIIEVMGHDYIRTARSKGLRESTLVWRHALKNAMFPIITIAALQVASLLAGVVIIETVFTRPGLGRAMIDAINNRDYPVVQGLFLFMMLVFIVVNLAADIAYGLVDPRLRTAN